MKVQLPVIVTAFPGMVKVLPAPLMVTSVEIQSLNVHVPNTPLPLSVALDVGFPLTVTVEPC